MVIRKKMMGDLSGELAKVLSQSELDDVLAIIGRDAIDQELTLKDLEQDMIDIDNDDLVPPEGSGVGGNGDDEGDDDGEGEGEGEEGDEGDPPDDTTSDSDSESDSPMDDVLKPENSDDRSYEPEGNIQDDDPTSKPSVGNDPSCKQIFDPGVKRMKRGIAYNRLVLGGKEGYQFLITKDKSDLHQIELKPELKTSGLLEMKGDCTVQVESTEPTPLFMPTVEVNIGDYMTSDGTRLTFYRDRLNNVYVKSNNSLVNKIKLQYNVYCDYLNGNLEYYDLKFDAKFNLYDSYKDGQKIKFNFDLALDSVQRKKVSFILKHIDEKFFGEIIDKGLDEQIRKNYSYQRVVEKLRLFFYNYGCSNIPGLTYSKGKLINGDMVLNGVWYDGNSIKQGSCRHRAIGFFMCGNYLGIPTRYCCSDCHAYVEIWMPNLQKWRAIDLGGCDPESMKKLAKMTKFKEGLTDKLKWKADEYRFKIAVEGFWTYLNS